MHFAHVVGEDVAGAVDIRLRKAVEIVTCEIELEPVQIVTAAEVLDELLPVFADSGPTIGSSSSWSASNAVCTR